MKFEAWQIIEIIKCSKEPIYFIEKYVKIGHLISGISNVTLNPYQIDLINTLHSSRSVVGMMPRQSGKTITNLLYIFWYLTFNSNKTVVVASANFRMSMGCIERLNIMNENLPEWLRSGLLVYNRNHMKFTNGSTIDFMTFDNDYLRGRNVDYLYIDEFAYSDNTKAEHFLSSVYPCLSGGHAKLVVFSTPSNISHPYAKLWNTNSTDISKFQIKFTQLPQYDEAWKQQVISNIGNDAFLKEYECKFES